MAAGCSGYARVDCFLEPERALINEINTAPGFTRTSVFARLFESSGISYPDLLNRLIEVALAAFNEREKFEF